MVFCLFFGVFAFFGALFLPFGHFWVEVKGFCLNSNYFESQYPRACIQARRRKQLQPRRGHGFHDRLPLVFAPRAPGLFRSLVLDALGYQDRLDVPLILAVKGGVGKTTLTGPPHSVSREPVPFVAFAPIPMFAEPSLFLLFLHTYSPSSGSKSSSSSSCS